MIELPVVTRDCDIELSLSATVVLSAVVLSAVVVLAAVLSTVTLMRVVLPLFPDPRPVVGMVFEGRISAIYTK